jgi:hypothetical protein
VFPEKEVRMADSSILGLFTLVGIVATTAVRDAASSCRA